MPYIKVKATPGAKKESFIQKSETVFEIKVKERAQKNFANQKIIKLIAEHFNVSEQEVRIVNGHRHFSKLISIKE